MELLVIHVVVVIIIDVNICLPYVYVGEMYILFTYRIERKANTPVTIDCDYTLLKEREAFELVQQISLFPELVEASFKTLEPCTIVNYLFKLSHAISTANNRLRVKNMNPELAASRMLLFWAAKTTLSNGLSLLGLRPIERM